MLKSAPIVIIFSGVLEDFDDLWSSIIFLLLLFYFCEVDWEISFLYNLSYVINEWTTLQLNKKDQKWIDSLKFGWFPTKIKHFLTNPDDNLKK